MIYYFGGWGSGVTQLGRVFADVAQPVDILLSFATQSHPQILVELGRSNRRLPESFWPPLLHHKLKLKRQRKTLL